MEVLAEQGWEDHEGGWVTPSQKVSDRDGAGGAESAVTMSSVTTGHLRALPAPACAEGCPCRLG